MTCPADVAEILFEILNLGVIRARAAGWSGDAARAAVEADHIHNLPGLIARFDPDRLYYYWETERPAYLAQTQEARTFRELWDRLQALIESTTLTAATG